MEKSLYFKEELPLFNTRIYKSLHSFIDDHEKIRTT